MSGSKTRNIICIGYKQRRGKDTLARMLKEQLPDYKIVPLAQAIKQDYLDVVNAMIGTEIGIDQLNLMKNTNPQVRKTLIEIGNRKRKQDLHYWVKRVLDVPGNLIIPDLRYQHEMDALLNSGANVYFVNVVCSREMAAERGTLSNEDDASEVELDRVKEWDFIVVNTGSLQELYQHAEMIADHVRPTKKINQLV